VQRQERKAFSHLYAPHPTGTEGHRRKIVDSLIVTAVAHLRVPYVVGEGEREVRIIQHIPPPLPVCSRRKVETYFGDRRSAARLGSTTLGSAL
jgi:hypothetical protein